MKGSTFVIFKGLEPLRNALFWAASALETGKSDATAAIPPILKNWRREFIELSADAN